MTRKKILILGISGMLGHVLFEHLMEKADYDVFGTVRSRDDISRRIPAESIEKIEAGVDVSDHDNLVRVFSIVQPDVVVNCVGVIKQSPLSKDPMTSIPINALLPHRIMMLCKIAGARLVHVSTDCVFSGRKGFYNEDDRPDPEDLYGLSKLLGEVSDGHCVTLRTSLIGHEIKTKHGLIEWFLSQEGRTKGFARAFFTGFPTIEFVRILERFVIFNKELSGVYHVSSEPISKYDLLALVSREYGKEIEIERDEEFSCDRSLDSGRFRRATGYVPPPWEELVRVMHEDFMKSRSGR